MTDQPGRTYRRAIVTLVPPVVAAAAVVGVFAALGHRLPDEAYGTGGFRDSTSWSRVLGLTVVWSVVTMVWGGAWLYGRRRIPTAQRWIGASTWVASVLIAGHMLQVVLRNVDLARPPARPEPAWTSPLVVVPVLVVVALVAASAGGDVLRLQTSNGHWFIITVPGAATAAGLVNTELDRRRATADDRC
jgi:hypothetical protein